MVNFIRILDKMPYKAVRSYFVAGTGAVTVVFGALADGAVTAFVITRLIRLVAPVSALLVIDWGVMLMVGAREGGGVTGFASCGYFSSKSARRIPASEPIPLNWLAFTNSS